MEKRSNKKIVLILAGVAVGMFTLAFASVPLYRAFCQITGFGGVTQIASQTDEVPIIDRWVTVRFNADTDPNLDWDFRPEQKEVTVRVGESNLVSYSATNLSDAPITGTAVYNTTPVKTGSYFFKQQCFCFDEQTINPGEKVFLPISFYIDPSIVEDSNLDDVKTITLSYTFFKMDDEE